MSRRRITFVASGLGRGGAELQLVQLAERLVASDWIVNVITMQSAGVYTERLARRGIGVYEAVVGRVASPAAFWKLQAAIAHTKPSLVHTQAFRANLWGRICAVLAGVPVVASVRATYSYVPRPYYTIEKWLGRRSAAVITPAEATSQHLVEVVGVPADRVITIPNGVDTDTFHPSRSGKAFREMFGLTDRFVVLAPGRLAPQKDHDHVLTAFRVLRGRGENAVLVIAGTGPLEGQIRRNSADLGDSVLFTGDLDREQVADAVAASDCVVLASHFEGMPNVLLEAMAGSRPSIATATDGAVEVIRDGIDGYLTAASEPATMGQKLVELAHDRPLRKRMGLAARERAVRDFSIASNVARHLEVYLSAISDWPVGSHPHHDAVVYD